MIKIFITIALLILTSCTASYQISEKEVLSSSTYYEMLGLIENHTFQVDSLKSKIPFSIKSTISDFNKEKFKIANPNQKCNLGCVRHFPDTPIRQLQMIATSEHAIILTYIKGGRGVSAHILIAKMKGNKIDKIWAGRGNRNLKSPKSVIEWMQKHKAEELNSNIVNL